MRWQVLTTGLLRHARPFTLRAVSVTVGASLLLAPWMAIVHHAAAQEAKLRIEVGDNGFNGNPGDFTIEVNQGQQVELTFAWAHKIHVHDEHVITLSGYKLESEKLTAEKREVTLKFIADKSGTFDFQCDLDCEAHDALQRGRLRVRAGGSAGNGAASLTKTALTLKPSTTTVTNGLLLLQAVLRDDKGAPVPKAIIQFAVDSEFAGVKGRVVIGTAQADANGVAFLYYQPRKEDVSQTITARFEGQGLFGESEQSSQIEVRAGAPGYHMESIGLESIRDWAPAALAAAVVVVWLIVGLALLQVVGIARVRRQP